MNITELITIPNIVFALIIAERIFSIFNYFKNPQIQSDKNDLMLSASVASLKEALEHFKNNDLHTMQKTLELHENSIRFLTLETAKLQTIIDERIPKKTN